MPVCRFWERGNCRNGENCRFDHPSAQQSGGRSGGNPFGAPSGDQARNPFSSGRDDQPRGGRPGGDSYRPETRRNDHDRGRSDDRSRGPQSFSAASSNHGDSAGRRYHMDADIMKVDLTADLPSYPLSNYAGQGTNTDPPKHLFPPEMEISPEELRVEYYLAKLQGQEGAAQAKEGQLVASALGEIEKVRNDIHGAIKMIAAAKREHPNRWDIVDANKGWSAPNPFPYAPLPRSAPSDPAQSSPFGQPSNLGAGANLFGQLSAPAQTGANAFGQPSQTRPQSSGFGQPSQIGGQSQAFGQPSQPVGQNPFGQASQPQAAPAFGQPSQPQGGAFGQPSGLGARPAFGQPSAAGAPTAFGQPSGVGQAANKPNPFGRPSSNNAPPFGQASQTPSQPNPFGQAPGQGGHGQPQPPSNGFSQPQAPTNGFGQPSNVFNQPSQPVQQSSNGFSQPQNAFVRAPSTNGFAQQSLQLNTAQPTMNGGGSYTTNPPSAGPRDADPPEQMYGSKKAEYEEAYRYILTAGTFANDEMPEVAPLHHWVGWGSMERKFQA